MENSAVERVGSDRRLSRQHKPGRERRSVTVALAGLSSVLCGAHLLTLSPITR
ncbi:hypothetical protein FBY35_3353 [Streptomyces sp. SLBN-118]|nr:hypothetical protein FBY35_3353 [Streptomyces sp. SLBN-118]